MKALVITCMMLIFLSSCDIMKSITFINKTEKDITIRVRPFEENPYFINQENLNIFHLSSQGDQSRRVLLKGFGKWVKSDPSDLADILTMSDIYYGIKSDSTSLINPDLLRVKRTGIFGSNLKIILK